MASRPYQASRYLQDPQDQAAYLMEVLTHGDTQVLLVALQNLADVDSAMGGPGFHSICQVKSVSPKFGIAFVGGSGQSH